MKPGAASAVLNIWGSYTPPIHAIRRRLAVVIKPDLPAPDAGKSHQVCLVGHTH